MTKLVKAVENWAFEQGLSTTAAIKRLGISSNIWSRWKHGGGIHTATLHRLAEQLGVSPEDLKDDVDDANQNASSKAKLAATASSGMAVLLSVNISDYQLFRESLSRCGAKFVACCEQAAVTGVELLPRLLTLGGIAEDAAA